MGWNYVKKVYHKFNRVNRRYNGALQYLNKIEDQMVRRRDWAEKIMDKLSHLKQLHYEIKELQLLSRQSDSRRERRHAAKRIKVKQEAMEDDMDYVRRRMAQVDETKPKRKLVKRMFKFETAVRTIFRAEEK